MAEKLEFKMALDIQEAKENVKKTFQDSKEMTTMPSGAVLPVGRALPSGTLALPQNMKLPTDSPTIPAAGKSADAAGLSGQVRKLGDTAESSILGKLGASSKIMKLFSKAGPYGVALGALASAVAAPFMKSMLSAVARVREEWTRGSEMLNNSDSKRLAARQKLNIEAERLGKKIAGLFYRIFPDFNGKIARIFAGMSEFIDKIAPVVGKLADVFWSLASVIGKVFSTIWKGITSVLGFIAKLIPGLSWLMKGNAKDNSIKKWSDTYQGRNNGGAFTSAEGLWKSLASGAAKANPGLQEQKGIRAELTASKRIQQESKGYQQDSAFYLKLIANRMMNKKKIQEYELEKNRAALAAEG